ncbi:MAG: radical SAM/SPASM domain-containing protein [bacterium]
MFNLFRVIQIQTRTNCNRRCEFCANSYIKHSAPRQMDDKLFQSIIIQLKNMGFNGRISPYLMNEPLLDNNLESKINYIKKMCPKAHIRINSNGDMLSTERLKSLFESGMDGLIVDCYDSLSQFKEMIAMAKNALTIYPDIAVQPSFDIRILPIAQKYVRVCDCSDYGKNSSYLTNMAGIVPRNIGGKLPLKRSCFTIFEQMYINYRGDVILCCQDWNFDVIVGNAKKDSLQDIWMGESLTHYREKLLDGDRKKLLLCSTCDAASEDDNATSENDTNYLK